MEKDKYNENFICDFLLQNENPIVICDDSYKVLIDPNASLV